MKKKNDDEDEVVIRNVPIQSLEQVATLCSDNGEPKLRNIVETQLRPVSVVAGKIEIEKQDSLPINITRELSQKLTEWTGENWEVMTSDKSGSPTISELKETLRNEALEDAKQDSVVSEILDSFDGAKTTEVRKTNPRSSNFTMVNG